MAKSTYAADLQAKLDDEIAALRAQRESATPPAGATQSPAAPAAPLPLAEEAAPAAIAPPSPAPGEPHAAPAPARPPLARVGTRGVGRARLAIAVGAVLVLLISAVVQVRLVRPLEAFRPTPAPAVGLVVLSLVVVLLLLVLVLFMLLCRRRAYRAAARTERGLPSVTPAAIGGPQAIAALDQRIARLEQLRAWMGEDPELGRLIDATIGAQVRASERRQRLFSGVVAVASLAVGWILNAVSLPEILAGFFGHWGPW